MSTMTILAGHHHSPIAFIHNNILALPNGKVVGVTLGHCVFGTNGEVKAKYFKHTLYTLEGKLLAKEETSRHTFTPDIDQLLRDAWLLITKIKDHTCPMINPTEQWTAISLSEHFAGI